MKATVVFKNKKRSDLTLRVNKSLANSLINNSGIITNIALKLFNNKFSPIDFIIFG